MQLAVLTQIFRCIVILSLGLSGPAIAQLLPYDQRLQAATPMDLNHFGWAVAIDTNTAAVSRLRDQNSTPFSDAVEIYLKDELGNWNLTQTLHSPLAEQPNGRHSGSFGYSIDLSGDILVVGDYAANGTPKDDADAPGAAWVYERDVNGLWQMKARLMGQGPHFGDYLQEDLQSGLAVSVDGDMIAIGGRERIYNVATGQRRTHGTSYIFERQDNGDWQQVASFQAQGDPIGFSYYATQPFSVDINQARLLVGAYGGMYPDNEPSAHCQHSYIYARTDTGWALEQRLRPPSAGGCGSTSGSGRAVKLDGNLAVIGGNGFVAIYKRDNQLWTLEREIHAGTDIPGAGIQFGHALALDNNLLLVGGGTSPGAQGNVTRIKRGAQSQWQDYCIWQGEPGSNLGASVALNGTHSIIGATTTPSDQHDKAGAAYTFDAGTNCGITAQFDYLPSAPLTGESIQFIDTSHADEGLQSWRWDFDGHGHSELQNPSFSFDDDGNYSVCLTVFDQIERQDTHCQIITVRNQGPHAEFTHSSPANTTSPTSFTDLSGDADGQITSWHWDFGNGASSQAQHPVHQYGQAGDYLVCLHVEDDDAATDQLCKMLRVEQTSLMHYGKAYGLQLKPLLKPVARAQRRDSCGGPASSHGEFIGVAIPGVSAQAIATEVNVDPSGSKASVYIPYLSARLSPLLKLELVGLKVIAQTNSAKDTPHRGYMSIASLRVNGKQLVRDLLEPDSNTRLKIAPNLKLILNHQHIDDDQITVNGLKLVAPLGVELTVGHAIAGYAECL